MRFAVETWAPDYGAPVDGAVMDDSTATVDLAAEVDVAAWAPITPGVAPATTVLFVDGVQRIDARVWVTDDDGVSRQGVCASWAAGVVRCDVRAEVVSAEVRRGVLCAGVSAGTIATGHGDYRAYPVTEVGGDPIGLALGQHRGDLEGRVAVESRHASGLGGLAGADPVEFGPGRYTRSATPAARPAAVPVASGWAPAGADAGRVPAPAGPGSGDASGASLAPVGPGPAGDYRPGPAGDYRPGPAGGDYGAVPGGPGDAHASGRGSGPAGAGHDHGPDDDGPGASGAPADDDLLVVDGPLGARRHMTGAVGYVKAHHVSYLQPAQQQVVGALAPGQRTPLFTVGDHRFRWSWYLRLPGPATHPWWGVVRCEASGELARDAAVATADRVTATLPRFASQPHNDARAPQNLHPIAGLERELRRRLGDPVLLDRALRRSAAAS